MPAVASRSDADAGLLMLRTSYGWQATRRDAGLVVSANELRLASHAKAGLPGSRLCRDEVQPVRRGEIKRIADRRRARIERRIHLDRGQHFLAPSGTKNGHGAFNVPNVKPVARQQETSPDR